MPRICSPKHLLHNGPLRHYNGCYLLRSRSQWPSVLKRVSTADRLLGLQVRIPPAAWMVVRCLCCLLSGTSLCDGLITRPEEFYRLWCALVYDLGTSRMRRLKLVRVVNAGWKERKKERKEFIFLGD